MINMKKILITLAALLAFTGMANADMPPQVSDPTTGTDFQFGRRVTKYNAIQTHLDKRWSVWEVRTDGYQEHALVVYTDGLIYISLQDDNTELPSTEGAYWNKFESGGVTDHGVLTGLSDNDHTQYLQTVVGGVNVTVDNTDPQNPIITVSGATHDAVTLATGVNTLILTGQEIDVVSIIEAISDTTAVNGAIFGYDAVGVFELKTVIDIDVLFADEIPTSGDGHLTRSGFDALLMDSGASYERWTNDAGIATVVTIDASGFDGNLSSIDDTMQEVSQALDDLATGGGGTGYVTTPTYSDESCTIGQYSWDGTYYYGCETTDQWDRFAVTWAAWSDPAPATWDLTLAVTGLGTLTVNGSDYTTTGSPHSIVGLTESAAYAMTGAYGSGEDTLEWSGADAAEVSGSYPDYTLNLVADRSIGADFSAASASCDIVAGLTNTTSNDYSGNSDGTGEYQEIGNSTTLDICKIDAQIFRFFADITVKIEIWSDAAMLGTKYAESDADVTVTDTVNGGAFYSWDMTTTTQPTGDFYVHFIQTDGGSGFMKMNENTDTSSFGGTGYTLFWAGIDTVRDASMSVYAQ